MTSRNGQLLAFVLLALFFAQHNIVTISYQLRGMPPAQLLVLLGTYHLTLLLTSTGFDLYTRWQLRKNGGIFSAYGESVPRPLFFLIALLLLPACADLTAQFFTWGSWGVALLNLGQMPFWVLYVPVCFHFFRTRVPARLYMPYCGIALGGGHVVWGLLAPLAGPLTVQAPALAAAAAVQYQLMLNIVQLAFTVGICFILYRLSTRHPPQTRPLTGIIHALHLGSTQPAFFSPKVPEQGFPVLFLLPVGVIFFMNGVGGNIYSARLHTYGPFPGLMHLAIGSLFCLAAFSLRHRNTLLKPYLYGAFLLMAVSPGLFLLPSTSMAYQAMHSVFSIGHQSLILFCAFTTLTHAPQSKWPLTATCSAWLITGMNLPGALFSHFVLPHLPFSRFAVLCACAVLALALFPLLRKAFPLPEAPEEALEEPHTIGAENGLSIQEATAASLAAFAAHYTLTERERQIVALLVQGASSEEMTQTLGIKDSTLRPYISRLLKKTETDNRLHLARLASSFQTKGGTPHGTTSR